MSVITQQEISGVQALPPAAALDQVLRDQFVFMLRAGFDSFDVKKQADAEAFGESARRYSVFYQPTGDGHPSALQRRGHSRHSESAKP